MAIVNVSEERIELTAIDKAYAVFRQTQWRIAELGAGIDGVRGSIGS
jgi:hypothetical protein